MPSIGVLEHNQKPTDKPTRRIKRSGGQSLVRQGLAIWLRENVLLIMCRQVPEQVYANSSMAGRKYTPNGDVRPRAYIPEKLPANIDYKLGLTVQAPILANQVRFRPIADQRSHPAY